jgi:hypothetical protein
MLAPRRSHLASAEGAYSIVQWLVEECKVNINCIDRFKRTPLEVRAPPGLRWLRPAPPGSHLRAARLPSARAARLPPARSQAVLLRQPLLPCSPLPAVQSRSRSLGRPPRRGRTPCTPRCSPSPRLPTRLAKHPQDAVRGDHGMVAKFLAENGAKLLSKDGELIDLNESPLSMNVSGLPLGARLWGWPAQGVRCAARRPGRAALLLPLPPGSGGRAAALRPGPLLRLQRLPLAAGAHLRRVRP